jgi:hypothetical protein
MRLEKVVAPQEPQPLEDLKKKEDKNKSDKKSGNAKVISLSDLKKK